MNQEEKTLIENAINILDGQLKTADFIAHDAEAVKQYLRLKLEPAEREVFAVLLLDNSHKLIRYIELFFGTIDQAAIYPREVAKEALVNNAAAIILAHNHPSGSAEASPADRQITRHIEKCASLFDIRLLDHLIVAKGKVISLAQQGLL